MSMQDICTGGYWRKGIAWLGMSVIVLGWQAKP